MGGGEAGHLGAFVIASAGLVGLGRVNFPLAEVISLRYRPLGLLLWTSLLIFYASLAGVRLRRWIALSAVLWMAGGMALQERAWIVYARMYEGEREKAASAIVAGVFDRDAWVRAYHTPELLPEVLAYFRANRLSVFSEEWTRWTGQPINRFRVDAGKQCTGGVETVAPIVDPAMPGWRINGWAGGPRLPKTVILVDDAQHVAGVARGVGGPRWQGYISGRESRPVTPYLLEDDQRSLCALTPRP